MNATAADFQLYLASQSPRRRRLLAELGLDFTVVHSDAEERLEGDDPRTLAEANALAKVMGAAVPDARTGAPCGGSAGGPRDAGRFVLGSDTLVVVDAMVLGKPASAEEAADMLRRLSGRQHHVVTGVAVASVSRSGDERHVRQGSAVTHVWFSTLSPDDIDAYLTCGEWRDKAGAYAVQGRAALFVERLEGEYSNVVGLPLHLLYTLFRELGFDLLRRRWVEERL